MARRNLALLTALVLLALLTVYALRHTIVIEDSEPIQITEVRKN